MGEQSIASVFSAGVRYDLGLADTFGLSYFGGPGYDSVIEGPRYGPRRLHHIMTLNHGEFGISALQYGFKVSFYYGMCFEGCQLSWQRTATAAVRITQISPRKSGAEYPYYGFPDILPYFPLRIIQREEHTTEELESAFYNSAWAFDPRHVYVVVSDHPQVGLSLFEPGSDTSIIFDYDPTSGVVNASNQTG